MSRFGTVWRHHCLVFRLSVFLLVLSLPACLTVKPAEIAETIPVIEIRGLSIRNQSFSAVTEVILLVIETGEFISCGNIGMRSECATTFPLRQYQGNKIEIKWKQGGSEWSTGEFVIEASSEIAVNKPTIVSVIITAQGLAPTKLIQ